MFVLHSVDTLHDRKIIKNQANCRGACYMTPMGRVRSITNAPPGASEMTPLAIDG